MTVPFVDARELAERLPMLAAIDALEAAFRDEDPSGTPLRSHQATPGGTLLMMPAAGTPGVGVKLVTLTATNPARGLPLIHAVYVLFEPDTQAPRLLVDGAALTALRTAAVSGLATRYLARADARRLVIFGAGVQARAHLESMAAVRGITHVTVVGRDAARASRLVDLARAAGLEAAQGGAGSVVEADVVCTCTTSIEPVFVGAELAEGAHVNAVGAYRPETREVDGQAVGRARVVVETRDAAMAESGDLLLAIAEGAVGPEHVAADLHEVLAGAEVRRGTDDITLFESVGLAFEDLAVAGALARSM